MKLPKQIQFEIPEMEEFDCDCCGWYSYGSFTTIIDGIPTEHNHDGHFGYGDWNGEDDGMHTLAIGDIFDAHYVELQTDNYQQLFGSRIDIDSYQLSNEEYNEYIKLSPNKTVYIRIFEEEAKFTVTFDYIEVNGVLYDDVYYEPYERDGVVHKTLDIGKAMKYIFRKTCQVLKIEVDYINID